MTGKKSVDSLADATLAREIEGLLDVAPSSEFLARIRTRLAEEPPLPDTRAIGASSLSAREMRPRGRWWNSLLRESIRFPVPMSIGIAALVAAALVLIILHWPARETPGKTVALAAPSVQKAGTIPPRPASRSTVQQGGLKPAEPAEIVTAFFPLMQDPPPFERGLLVRMTVPASVMRAVGLPVGDNHLSDPVQADLLLGQDDLARAIRFVSYRKSRD